MGYIPRSFSDELLEKVDIKDIVSDYTEIKKQGANWFGLSPFVTEKTPSFCVNDKKQRFTCYSSGKSGNVVTFLMEHKHMTYPEAIETIAQKYGIEVEYDNPEKAAEYAKEAEKKEELRPILTTALEAYKQAFAALPNTHPAKVEVLEKRQYTKEIILDWQICYAPGQQFLLNKLDPKQLNEAAEIGLLNKDKTKDKLWNRVLYPIHDIRGLFIGFAGRNLDTSKKYSKWVNPSDSLIYKKEKVWYALDRAIDTINKTGEAWLVEGYNDVIAWHTHGLTNTIASCGTSIPEPAIKLLKKYTTKIVFCFDGDPPGAKSMLRYIPVFLAEGFRVEVVQLPKCDPDDFVRLREKEISEEKKQLQKILEQQKEEIEEEEIIKSLDVSEKYAQKIVGLLDSNENNIDKISLTLILEKETTRVDGFKLLMEAQLQGSAVDKSTGAQRLCKTISTIKDEAIVEIYIAWLVKKSKLTKTTINKWVKAFIEQAKEKEEEKNYIKYDDDEFYYTLPDEVSIPFRDLKNDIYKYAMFMANNKVFMKSKSAEGEQSNFYAVTNFSVEIIQHMQDEKFPMKLLRIKNIHNLEKIFDVPSEQLNTPMGFDNAVTAHGNFLWTGGRNEFQKLRAYLFDKMGTGRKIDVLGWQSEGFWAWNNTITVPGEKSLELDDNGIFIYDKTSYYIPSANKIYAQNQFKYDAQKRFEVVKSGVSFSTFFTKAIKVHRDHAITGVLFAIASAFQDIVVDELGNFPIFYLYGPASTGKDQLAEICQSFFGTPQTAINLEGGVSTVKAQVREFAQFVNSMSHLSEYKRGDPKLDGILKGLWDRRGYKRGNIESHVGTESIPILSSVILTGNDYPDNEALITRVLWNEMTKNTFNDEEVKNFEELRDMTKGGISSFTNSILEHRSTFKDNFQKKYRMFKETFQERMPEAKSRMISNVSILGATYSIFQNILDFPFSFVQMQEHFVNCTEKQIRKLNSASIVNKWWDCYLSALLGHKDDRLQVGVDLKIEQRRLFFNFTNVYNKIQRQWWTQFHETMPGKSTMKDQLKKESSFITAHAKGIRMDEGRDAINTSAYEVDLTKINLEDELFNAIQYQLEEGTLFHKEIESPATPKEQLILRNENGDFFENIKDNE